MNDLLAESPSGTRADSPEELAIRLAIVSGNRDRNALTSALFYGRHPERNRRPLDPGEPGFAGLRDEWLQIRATIVDPMLARIPAGGSAPGTSPAAPLASGVWVPGAERVENAKGRGLPYVDGPWRFVFHTTETEPSEVGFRRMAARHRNPPHLWAMPSADLLLQTVPLDRAAWALQRPSGTVHTNRLHAIQVELWGFARDMGTAPASVIDWLARRLLAPVARLVPINLSNVRPTGGNKCYGKRSACRMTPDEWRAFDGVCGHQHVPNNSHWDPGLLDLAGIAARATALVSGTSISPEAELEPDHEEGDEHGVIAEDGGPSGASVDGVGEEGEVYEVETGYELEPEFGEADSYAQAAYGDDGESAVSEFAGVQLLNSPFSAEDDWESEASWIETSAEEDEVAAFAASPDGTGAACTFPSGTRLTVVTGGTGPGEEHWDPNGSGEPLYDTGPAVRATRLATNFTVGELATSGGRPSDRARISCELVRCLQSLRTHVGRAVFVTSGYRSYQRNVAIYQARGQRPTNSQHSSGRAADIRISGMTGLEIAKLTMQLCGTSIGVGVGNSFAHVDVRGAWARWTYLEDPAESARVIADLEAHKRALSGRSPADTSSTPRGGPSAAPYPVVSGRTYGRKWGDRRPPGLPAWVRGASAPNAARADVARTAAAYGLGPTFVKLCEQMAITESGATYGLPANTFNADPPDQRPPGVRLITAWGVFQYNRDAWTARFPAEQRRHRRSWVERGSGGCTSRDGCVYPWDADPTEEIAVPIAHFAETFREVRAAGGNDRDAAAGVRIRHMSPAVAYPEFLSRGRTDRFDAAWSTLSPSIRESVEGFLARMEALS